MFSEIRRRQPPKGKFVYRAIISRDSTCGLVISCSTPPGLFRVTSDLGEERAMNLGFFTMPIHPLEKDWQLSLREDREAFLLADELGVTGGYVGEHVTDRA